MEWLPNALHEIRLLIEKHEFAGGFLTALIFVGLLRRYFFRSSELILQKIIDSLEQKIKKLEKPLEQERGKKKKE